MLAFLRRAFLIILGFLLIAVFIWNAGPYFAFADYRPLEPPLARLIAIAVVVVFWAVYALFKRLQAYRKSDKLLAAVIAQPKAEPAKPSAEAVKLRERFEEAVATLKQQRRGGHSLYDLPWYVIIGAPGSGKTTALLNSGLKFPLEQRVGKGALRGVGGTRNCDWWFTDEAVFLDTAGRYTTQDSDAASDSAGWGEFLALLRKYRARRPVNGVILTINAQDLIVQGDAAREAHVEAARRRLNELNSELRIQLPVYVMVTKCDLVAGFTEYFDDLTQEGRAQVWGVTFPYEQTIESEAAPAFPSEFDALMTRLNERVFARIEDVRDVRRRTSVFAFPQQMASMRDALAQFVSEVFASTHFDRQVLLRGVYFTSGTQDGTPVDRLLGAIGRRFGVAAEAVAPASGPGKAYFVERLLKEVMIGESGLAGVNRRLETKKAAAQLGAYAGVGLIAALGVALLTLSYSRNRAYLTRTAADVAALQQLPAVPPSASLEQLLPRFNAIRAVVESAEAYRADTTWAMRWGLYQGGSIGNSARDAYVRELDGTLLPRVAARIKSRITQYASDPQKLFIYLKSYLMLGEPSHLDKGHLQTLADLEWKSANGDAAGTQLSTHFQSLLDYSDTLRPIAIDRALVAQVRNSIRQASMAQIQYDQIKRNFADDRTRALRLDSEIGVSADKVFKRKSGRSLSEPLPSLYAKPVFREITEQGRAELIKQLARDSWVWGEDIASRGKPAEIALAVNNLYELDYIRTWDALLDDLEFVKFATVAQINDALRILTGPTSPLRGLLRVVVNNTMLTEMQKTSGEPTLKDKVTLGVQNALKPLQSAAGIPNVSPGALVTAHFQPIQQLTAGEAGKAPIDAIVGVIGEIQQHVAALGPDVAGADPVDILSSPALRGLLRTLREQAEGLPPGLRTLVADIGRESERTIVADASGAIDARYKQDVIPACRALIENRYPFQSSSNVDVSLTDFGTVFGYGGAFDRFFTENLEKQVDTSGSRWTWRPGSARASDGILEQVQAAYRIRELFFTKGSPLPAMTFFVTPRNLDSSATRFVLQIDGQLFALQRGQGAKTLVNWPGKSGDAVASFESRFLPEHPLSYGGPWAWFRMIDKTARPPDGQQNLLLDIRSEYHRVEVLVEPSSARSNPFGSQPWRQFSCGSS